MPGSFTALWVAGVRLPSPASSGMGACGDPPRRGRSVGKGGKVGCSCEAPRAAAGWWPSWPAGTGVCSGSCIAGALSALARTLLDSTPAPADPVFSSSCAPNRTTSITTQNTASASKPRRVGVSAAAPSRRPRAVVVVALPEALGLFSTRSDLPRCGGAACVPSPQQSVRCSSTRRGLPCNRDDPARVSRIPQAVSSTTDSQALVRARDVNARRVALQSTQAERSARAASRGAMRFGLPLKSEANVRRPMTGEHALTIQRTRC